MHDKNYLKWQRFGWALFCCLALPLFAQSSHYNLSGDNPDTPTQQMIRTYVGKQFDYFSTYFHQDADFSGNWELSDVYYGRGAPIFQKWEMEARVEAMQTLHAIWRIGPRYDLAEAFHIDDTWEECDLSGYLCADATDIQSGTKKGDIWKPHTPAFEKDWPCEVISFPEFIDLSSYATALDGGGWARTETLDNCMLAGDETFMLCFSIIHRQVPQRGPAVFTQSGHLIFKFQRPADS